MVVCVKTVAVVATFRGCEIQTAGDGLRATFASANLQRDHRNR
jgi:hypothetical protein